MFTVPQSLSPDPFVPGAFRVMAGETSQSWVDPAHPTRLEFEYVQRIVEGLEATVLTRPDDVRLRVVHLGGGGLSLPRYVAARRPHTAQIVCEPDADLVEEVRRKLPLPKHSGIKVRVTEGRPGLAEMPGDYADVVILDAFDGMTVPASLVTGEFFADVARVLRPGGLLAANLADRIPFGWTKRVLAGIGASLRHLHLVSESAVLKGRRYGNLVVFASRERLPHDALARAAHGSPFPQRALFGRDLARWIGGAQPFTDDDAVWSPAPDGGRLWFS